LGDEWMNEYISCSRNCTFLLNKLSPPLSF
jgi:hypothetical protein